MKFSVRLSDGTEEVFEGYEGVTLTHTIKEDGALTVVSTVQLTRRDWETNQPIATPDAEPLIATIDAAYYAPSSWLRWRKSEDGTAGYVQDGNA